MNTKKAVARPYAETVDTPYVPSEHVVTIVGARPIAVDAPNEVCFAITGLEVRDLAPLYERIVEAIAAFDSEIPAGIDRNLAEEAAEEAVGLIHTGLLARLLARRIKR